MIPQRADHSIFRAHYDNQQQGRGARVIWRNSRSDGVRDAAPNSRTTSDKEVSELTGRGLNGR